MVTPILTYADMETLQELIRRLRRAGAKSDATRGCGVHIHIGAKGHTPQTLRNLANIMASHEDLLASALNLDRGRISRYCRTVDPRFLERLNRRKPTTMAELADIWYGSQNADYGRSQHYNDSRYHMLNLHATFTKGTVEFRLFQFDAPADGKQNGLHAGQLKSSHYDADAADYAVMFIESLCHTKGTWARQPFELIDWQEQIIRDIFGVLKPNGYRQFNTAYIEIPKKQGKSELAAVISGVLRVTFTPEVSSHGTIRSASWFIQYSSDPPLTYSLASCVEGLRYKNAMCSPPFAFCHAMRRPGERCADSSMRNKAPPE